MEEVIQQLCNTQLKILEKNEDDQWTARYKSEIQDVISKGDVGYFLKTRQECLEKQIRYENEHNSIIPYLLGICHEFDISKKSAYDYGEYPDIDIDYIDGVREYLKEDYAKKEFGEDKVCNIANYNTFGMKSALKDVARVFNLDHEEVEAITKGLKDKDEDGNVLTWEQALEIFDDLKAYCEAHPEVADAAHHMMGRIRSLGQHASGLIVSSVPIRDYVPLVRGKEGSPASAWIEGLHGTDLSTVGFIKFDFLGLDGNSKIATTCKMACQNKQSKTAKAEQLINKMVGDMTVCALLGVQDNGQPYPSWSDTSYLNDEKCMQFAKRGDLRMVFQFDGSPGIRKLAKEIGCNTFEDLVATTALYRPGPMKLGYHSVYAKRKNNIEPYTVHPSLSEGDANLSFTYGVLCYQEQIARMLNTIGKVPWKDCEVIRKAISKKKIDKFLKYKEAFIEGGQETLGETKEYLEHLWDQIEAFAGYGFNLSVDKNTLIPTTYDEVKKIEDFKPGDIVYGVDETGNVVETKVIAIHDHGVLDGYEITFDDGYSIICTLDHKFLTNKGQMPLWEIIREDMSILCNSKKDKNAQKKNRGLEGTMRFSACKSEDTRRSQETMSKVQNIGSGRKSVEVKSPSKMWTKGLNEERFVSASKNMREMQNFGMEEIDGGVPISVRTEAQDMETEGMASKNLSGMCNSKTGKHHCQEYQSQSVGGSSEKGVANSKNDFSQTRNSSSEGRKTENLERFQSGKVSKLNQQFNHDIQEVKNGSMGEGKIRLGVCANTVRSGEETSGFCFRKPLGGSRWASSLLQDKKPTTIKIGNRAAEGWHAARGSNTERKCDANSFKYGMFCEFDRGYEIGVADHIPRYAPVSDTRHLVSRKIVRIVPMGKRQMYDLEVACSTHNFLLPTGIITSNSHAVGYTYISSRMLWLKAYLPKQFFASMFTHTKASGPKDYNKLKEYKREAERNGVKMAALDINKSKKDFVVNEEDETIYYGFNKIKGIGEEAAKRLEELQPYTGFEDLLRRFGTHADPIKAIIALGCFKERDPVTLYKFSEYYKKFTKSENDRNKRYDVTRRKIEEEIMALRSQTNLERTAEWDETIPLPGKEDEFRKLCQAEASCIEVVEGGDEFPSEEYDEIEKQIKKVTKTQKKKIVVKETYEDKLAKLQDKLEKCVAGKEKKDQFIVYPKLCDFNPDETSSLKLNNEFIELLKDPTGEQIEIAFYGYVWKHPIERVPGYEGHTFEEFLESEEKDGIVEAIIRKVEERKGKKTTFYSISIEDSTGYQRSMTVWKDDYERFVDELKVNNIVKLHVDAPQLPYRTFTMHALGTKWRKPPKANDYRVRVLASV